MKKYIVHWSDDTRSKKIKANNLDEFAGEYILYLLEPY